ncbi:MAG: hypothetical protein J6K42_06820 [Clostridia bacterium]|nr:hypothetical protein [Clostridia bacterium]
MKKSVKILIVVLCVIIVGLVSFIVWDKLINIKKDDEHVNTINIEEKFVSNRADNSVNNADENNNAKSTNQTGIANEANGTEIKKTAEYAKEYIKIIDDFKSECPDFKCDLIYFNNDSIPDLVIDSGAISLYMYENGTVYTLMDKESYATGGCKYYDYYEKKGVISNFGTSLAGLICGENFYILNSKKELEHTFSYSTRGADLGEDEKMKEQVENELNQYGGYKYKGQKITKDEFERRLKEYGIEFSIDELWNTKSSIKKALAGTKTPSELKQQLEK